MNKEIFPVTIYKKDKHLVIMKMTHRQVVGYLFEVLDELFDDPSIDVREYVNKYSRKLVVIAKCAPEDTFNMDKGESICKHRLYIQLNGIIKMILFAMWENHLREKRNLINNIAKVYRSQRKERAELNKEIHSEV